LLKKIDKEFTPAPQRRSLARAHQSHPHRRQGRVRLSAHAQGAAGHGDPGGQGAGSLNDAAARHQGPHPLQIRGHDRQHHLPVVSDLVQRRFNPEAPNQLWCGDITYIAADKGWLYLAAVIDLLSRQVVGWSPLPHIETGLVRGTLAMAWFRRRPPEGLIFHSDRGSQYCSHVFQLALKGWGMRSLMSRKGNSWDNAAAESFWGRHKAASVHGNSSPPETWPSRR
jgi:transposase InsO family protein